MTRLLLYFILPVMVLAGCATTAKYEKALDTWIGASESELVKHWGPPDSVYQAGDAKKMLTYYSGGISYHPSVLPDYRITRYHDSIFVNHYGSVPIEVNQLKCKTSFTVKAERVTDWRWEGNHCV